MLKTESIMYDYKRLTYIYTLYTLVYKNKEKKKLVNYCFMFVLM